MSRPPNAHYMREQEPGGYNGPRLPRYDQATGAGHNMPYAPQHGAAPYHPPNAGMGHGAVPPPQQYVQPSQQYAQPSQQYAQPTQQYAQPTQQYAQPSQQFAPAPQQSSNVTLNMTSPGGGSGRCPWCGSDVTPVPRTQTKMAGHIAFVVMCLLGFWCFSFIPYCMNSCQEVKLKCPSCLKSR